MTTITVKDSAGLVSALKAAHAGDVVQLATGNYANVNLTGIKFSGTVTITSQDPNALAVLNGMTIKDSSGLVFKNLDMNAGATTSYSYYLYGSSNVTFDGVRIHGSLDGNALNDQGGLQIRGSTDITVTNSEIRQLNNGISHLDSNGLTFTNNYIREMSEDGIRGGGSSNVVVSGNYFTDFQRRSEGDHPDAIQFWTSNTKASASNITVSDNVVLRGAGDPLQGVFFRDQSDGTLPFQNVTITNNLVVGGLLQGVGVLHGNNVTISGNTVAGLPDQVSKIVAIGLQNSTLTNNVSTEYTIRSDVAENNNSTIDSPMDGGLAIAQAWMASMTADASASLKAVFESYAGGGLTVTHAYNLTAAQLEAAASNALAGINAARADVIELQGTAGADKLAADGIHDMVINGGAGDDLIYGSKGMSHNTLAGGAGDDKYVVFSANDKVVEAASAGFDAVTAYVDHTLSDNVEELKLAGDARYGGGNALANKISGGAGDDEIHGFGGDDQLTGGPGGDDKLYGGAGNDGLRGNAGHDTLSGDDGSDRLGGDEGNDLLSGGLGADTLEGGAGDDTMSGGAGGDIFVFRNGDLSPTGDVLRDFSRTEGDRINLAAIDANTGVAGDQKFAFIGASAFHRTAGELRMEVTNGVTHIYGDVNGDGAADIHLVLPGAGTLVGSDFVL